MQKFMDKIIIRKAVKKDAQIYFDWANDQLVRNFSYNTEIITWDDHKKWFFDKIADKNYFFYLFENQIGELIGQVRFQLSNEHEALISVSVANEFRGYGYGSKILKISCDVFLKNKPNSIINAYIKQENSNSINIFEKAGFSFKQKLIYNNFISYHYILYANK
jgi:RimJ/RimL family protein N-acetyltransferase